MSQNKHDDFGNIQECLREVNEMLVDELDDLIEEAESRLLWMPKETLH